MKRNRAKLYPECVETIIPGDLNDFLTEYKNETGMSENNIIRNLIKDLQNGDINIKDLEKYCY